MHVLCCVLIVCLLLSHLSLQAKTAVENLSLANKSNRNEVSCLSYSACIAFLSDDPICSVNECIDLFVQVLYYFLEQQFLTHVHRDEAVDAITLLRTQISTLNVFP